MDIEKLAEKCGAVKCNDVFAADNECSDLVYFSLEQLQAYTDAVIDECAGVGAKAQLNGQYVDEAILALKPNQDIDEEW